MRNFSHRGTGKRFICSIAAETGKSLGRKLTMIRYLCAIAACAALLRGQNGTGITGRVRDPQGRLVPGAQLRLYRQDARSASNTTVTSEDGTYQFEDLAPGTFLLEAEHDQFQTSTVTVHLERGAVKRVDIALALAGVNQSVIVTAAGQAQTPDEVSKAVSVVSHDEILNRNNYSLVDILTTIPGLQIRNEGGPGQFTAMSFRGLPDSAGAILVDGLRFRD